MIKTAKKVLEQNIYNILVNGLDLNAFFSFIDNKRYWQRLAVRGLIQLCS